MEGLEISVLNLSDIINDNISFRFDSTFFTKETVELDREIRQKKHFFLNSKEVVSGPFGSTLKSHSYLTEGIPFVRIQNIRGGFNIDKSEIIYISEDNNQILKNSQLFIDDLVLSKVGNSIGYYARVDEELKRCNISENNLGIKLQNYSQNLRHYILTYFNSKVGFDLTLRRISGNAQPKLNVFDITKIPIPEFSNNFYDKTSYLILLSKEQISKSKQFYIQAENILLEEIGLQNFTQSKEPVNIKSFKDSFGTSGRLDAEYYHRKYDSYEEQIRKTVDKVVLINDVLIEPIKNGTTPKDVIRENGNINFVRVEAFGSNLDFNDKNCFSVSGDTYDKYTHNRIIKDDILVSMTGTIGNVSIYNSKNKGLINQNLVKLTSNTEVVLVNYLAFYIKIVGKIFLKKLQTGNVQPYVNIPNFSNLIVPIIDYKKQEQIANLIEQSFSLKKQSEHLLEVAKKAVEIAIEENEEVALTYINQETK